MEATRGSASAELHPALCPGLKDGALVHMTAQDATTAARRREERAEQAEGQWEKMNAVYVRAEVTKEVKALGLMLGFFVAAVAGSAHAGSHQASVGQPSYTSPAGGSLQQQHHPQHQAAQHLTLMQQQHYQHSSQSAGSSSAGVGVPQQQPPGAVLF